MDMRDIDSTDWMLPRPDCILTLDIDALPEGFYDAAPVRVVHIRAPGDHIEHLLHRNAEIYSVELEESAVLTVVQALIVTRLRVRILLAPTERAQRLAPAVASVCCAGVGSSPVILLRADDAYLADIEDWIT